MPNWCANRWTLHSYDEDKLKEVVELMTHERDGKQQVTFTKIRPMPEVLKNTVSGGRKIDGQYYTSWAKDDEGNDRPFTKEEREELAKIGHYDWYNWRNEHWGVKWDASESDIGYDGGDLAIIHFDTAWGPPEPIFYALCELYPEVNIEAFYDEPGMQIAGYL